MPTLTSKDWTLAKRPVGEPQADDFAMVSNEAPEPGCGRDSGAQFLDVRRPIYARPDV